MDECLRTKWYPDPSSRLATIDMGRNVGFFNYCALFHMGEELAYTSVPRRFNRIFFFWGEGSRDTSTVSAYGAYPLPHCIVATTNPVSLGHWPLNVPTS